MLVTGALKRLTPRQSPAESVLLLCRVYGLGEEAAEPSSTAFDEQLTFRSPPKAQAAAARTPASSPAGKAGGQGVWPPARLALIGLTTYMNEGVTCVSRSRLHSRKLLQPAALPCTGSLEVQSAWLTANFDATTPCWRSTGRQGNAAEPYCVALQWPSNPLSLRGWCALMQLPSRTMWAPCLAYSCSEMWSCSRSLLFWVSLRALLHGGLHPEHVKG